MKLENNLPTLTAQLWTEPWNKTKSRPTFKPNIYEYTDGLITQMIKRYRLQVNPTAKTEHQS